MRPSHPAADVGVDELLATKGATTISVCLPARDEAATIGPIVAALHDELRLRRPLVDEILVVDDHSTDSTARAAADAGADVVAVADVLPHLDDRAGKGEAMWRSLAASTGDLVVWLDADLLGFDPLWVARLVGPLLLDPTVEMVKGHYRRVGTGGPDEDPAGGGRVTELVARPAISLLHPGLASIVQPLGGEYAGRRRTLEAVPFAGGYGVDLGLLVDIARLHGVAAIGQVDLGERRHRNRTLDQLGVQAAEVLHVALRRAGVAVGDEPLLVRPGQAVAPVEVRDRPPLVSLAPLPTP